MYHAPMGFVSRERRNTVNLTRENLRVVCTLEASDRVFPLISTGSSWTNTVFGVPSLYGTLAVTGHISCRN